MSQGGYIANTGDGAKPMPLSPLRRYRNSVNPSVKSGASPELPPPEEKVGAQRLLERAAAAGPNDELGVTFELAEVPFDWAPMRGLRDVKARAAVVDQRASQLAPIQSKLITWLSSIGAKDIEPHWLTNSVYARLPAKAVAKSLAHPDIVGVSGEASPVKDAAWTGRQLKDSTRISYANLFNITGHSGGRLIPRVIIGVVEANAAGDPAQPIYDLHAGFNRKPPATGSRIRNMMSCNTNPCSQMLSIPPWDPHGTAVAWTAAGSIEGGQDSAFPGTNTLAQQDRSGVLRDSYIKYFVGSGTDAIYRALSRALYEGVDIINMSWSVENDCGRNVDYSGINNALSNILDFGVVVVKSAGNSGSLPGCTLGWPAQRTEVLTVGAVDSSTTAPYDSLPMRVQSSRGGVQILSHSGTPGLLAGVDLVAPGLVINSFIPPGNSYSAGAVAGGTSTATPVVAGMVGALRDAFTDNGWDMSDGRAVMVNALLMGDGWDETTNPPPTAVMNIRTGAGRAKLHWPSDNDLGAPWGWGWRAIHLNQGDEVTWTVGDAAPEPASVTMWKWAVLWTAFNLNSVPDVDLFVENACPSGGGTVVLAQDVGYDVRARFRLTQAQITGRCLRMRARAYSVPPGGVTIYSADYFHSGTPLQH